MRASRHLKRRSDQLRRQLGAVGGRIEFGVGGARVSNATITRVTLIQDGAAPAQTMLYPIVRNSGKAKP